MTTTPDGEDRRLHPRMRVALPVRILAEAGSVPADVVDISEGGALIMGSDLPTGSRVKLEIELAELGWHVLDAEVVRREGAGPGEERLATRCSADLITLASRLPVTTTGGLTAPQKITDLEVQSSLKQLSELLRRRRWEADQANLVLDPNRMTAVTELSQLMTARETSVQQVSEPGAGGSEPKAEPFIQNALVTPTRLVEASKEIGQLELGSDLTVENDPASGRAHVYWRKRRGSAADAGRIELRASVTLSDATQTRPYSIVSYALALAGIVYLVGLFLSNWLTSNTDAAT